MATRCFAVPIGRPTWVDYFLYARLHPVVRGWSKEETWQHPAIFRFFDYIQHRDEIENLSAHDRSDLQPVALSDIMSIPDVSPFPTKRLNSGIQTSPQRATDQLPPCHRTIRQHLGRTNKIPRRNKPQSHLQKPHRRRTLNSISKSRASCRPSRGQKSEKGSQEGREERPKAETREET